MVHFSKRYINAMLILMIMIPKTNHKVAYNMICVNIEFWKSPRTICFCFRKKLKLYHEDFFQANKYHLQEI